MTKRMGHSAPRSREQKSEMICKIIWSLLAFKIYIANLEFLKNQKILSNSFNEYTV